MDELTGLIAVIMVFGGITAIVVLPNYFKSRERLEMQTTLRAAIEKGQPLPPEVIEAMTKTVKAPSTAIGDLRKGAVWLAIGIGLAVAGAAPAFMGYEETHPLLGIAAIPIAVGIAFIVLSFFNPNKGKASV